jgi:hypothetical protein
MTADPGFHPVSLITAAQEQISDSVLLGKILRLDSGSTSVTGLS